MVLEDIAHQLGQWESVDKCLVLLLADHIESLLETDVDIDQISDLVRERIVLQNQWVVLVSRGPDRDVHIQLGVLLLLGISIVLDGPLDVLGGESHDLTRLRVEPTVVVLQQDVVLKVVLRVLNQSDALAAHSEALDVTSEDRECQHLLLLIR